MTSPFVTYQAPEDRTLVTPSTEVRVKFRTTSGSSGRVGSVRVNGSYIATWIGGVLTPVSPYVVSVGNIPTEVTFTLTKTGGWPVGASDWVVNYEDSDGTASANGAFATDTATPAILFPESGQTAVPRHPFIYASFDMSHGTPCGVDLTLQGEIAIAYGLVQRPHFEGTSGGVGSRAFGGVRARRGFRWGERVRILAYPSVRYDNRIYRGRYEYQMTVGDRPASSVVSFSGRSATSNPAAEATRQLANTYLRPRAATPPIGTILRRLLQRSTIGQIAPPSVRRIPVELYPEDDPGDANLIAFVTAAAPLWQVLLDTVSGPEDRHALDVAWKSKHPIEQTGALSLLLLYAIEGRDAV